MSRTSALEDSPQPKTMLSGCPRWQLWRAPEKLRELERSFDNSNNISSRGLLGSFQMESIPFRWFGLLSDGLGSFQMVWAPFRWFGLLKDGIDSFQMAWAIVLSTFGIQAVAGGTVSRV